MKYKFKPHQTRAFKNIQEGLKTKDRLQYISACGTGKTLVGFNIIEDLLKEELKTIILFFPSLALIRQTYEAYLEYGLKIKDIDILFVCSDETVYCNEDAECNDILKDEVPFQVTTDTKNISNFIQFGSKNKIIFSTYHSSKMLSDGFSKAQSKADFGLYDEAHKTASNNDSYYNYTLDDKNIKINKRLFMTATPKHKNILDKDHDELLFSMNNPNRYGTVVEQYSVRKAIEDKVVAPYKIIVSIIDEDEVDTILAKEEKEVLNNLDIKKAAKIIGLIKTIEKYNIKKGLVFAERIKKSKEYVIAYDELMAGFNIHLDSKKSTKQIHEAFKYLKDAKRGMIFNATLLSEGIDVPSVDLVAFMEKTESSINIAQRIGRATRLDPANPEKIGYIFIPIFLSSTKDNLFQAALDSGNFNEMLEIINVMAEQDEVLHTISTHSKKDEERAKRDFRKIIEIDDYSNRFNISEREYLREKIETIALDRISSSWDKNYELLKEYYKEFGELPLTSTIYKKVNLGSWISTQKRLLYKGILSQERRDLLDQIDPRWKEDRDRARWNSSYELLKEYYKEFGELPLASTIYKNENLGSWFNTQKATYKANKLSDQRIKLLDAVDPSWSVDKHELAWNSSYELLKEYYREFGELPLTSTTYKGVKLREWIFSQRKSFSQEKLSQERRDLLDQIDPRWKEDWHKALWYSSYELLKEYYKEFGELPLTTTIYKNETLGNWLTTQKSNYKANKLSDQRIKLLDEIDLFWKMNRFEALWYSSYELLKEYYKEFGELPLTSTIYKKVNLGSWFNTQKAAYKANKLSDQRIKLLDEIGSTWSEGRTGNIWNSSYELLKEYYKEFGELPLTTTIYKNENLGSWISTQKKMKLTQERRDLLDQIDPRWKEDWRKYLYDNIWNSSYELLKEYYKEFGELPLTTTIYKKVNLGSWFNNQKSNYNANKLSEQRIKLLDAVDLNWFGKRGVTNGGGDVHKALWDSSYELLKEYYKEFGELPLTTTIYKNENLGSWINNQKSNYKANKLSDQRIKLLDEIDLFWKMNRFEALWYSSYELLKEYYKEFGELPLTSTTYKGVKLGTWFNNQKSNYKTNKLSEQRIKLLDAVDLNWKTKRKNGS